MQKPEDYLQTLKKNLEIAKAYADIHVDMEKNHYAVVLAGVTKLGKKFVTSQ